MKYLLRTISNNANHFKLKVSGEEEEEEKKQEDGRMYMCVKVRERIMSCFEFS